MVHLMLWCYSCSLNSSQIAPIESAFSAYILKFWLWISTKCNANNSQIAPKANKVTKSCWHKYLVGLYLLFSIFFKRFYLSVEELFVRLKIVYCLYKRKKNNRRASFVSNICFLSTWFSLILFQKYFLVKQYDDVFVKLLYNH